MIYLYQGNEEVFKIDSPNNINTSQKSRAEYFRNRRKNTKQFSVTLDKNKLEDFELYLAYNNKTKTDWLNEKIDEELNR